MPSQTQKKQAKSKIFRTYQPKVMNKHYKDVPRLHRLLAFIKDVLECGEHSDKIVWTNRDEQEFQFTAPHEFTKVYAKWVESPKMRFDTMSRSLRLYTEQGILSKTSGNDSTWRIMVEPGSKQGVIPMSLKTAVKFIKKFLKSNGKSN